MRTRLTETPSLDEVLAALALKIEEELGTAKIVAMRNEFFDLFGKVFHDDGFYDTRMSYFTNYLVFSNNFEKLPVNFDVTYLPGSRHSVYEIKKITDIQLSLIDLLQLDKIVIQAYDPLELSGLKKGEIIQGYICPFENQFRLTSGILSHPYKVGKFIKKFLKKKGELNLVSAKEILGVLAKTQLKSERMKHINPTILYKDLLAIP